MYDLVAFRGGFVALGDPSSYFSPDGRAWEAISLLVGSPALEESGVLATDGDRLVAAGGYEHDPCRQQPPGGGPDCAISPIAWVSSDGATWRSSRPTSATGETPDEIVAVWPDAGGGWEAALGSWGGESRSGNVVWHSADGLSWSERPALPVAWERTPPLVRTDWSGRRILILNLDAQLEERFVELSHALTSTDGRTWTVIPTFPVAGGLITAAVAPSSDSGQWLFGGSVDSMTTIPETELPETTTATIWHSPDGLRWTAVSLPATSADGSDPYRDAGGVVTAVVESPFGSVAIVARSSSDGASYETWTSQDARSWSPLPASSAPRACGPLVVAAGATSVVGIGSACDGEQSGDEQSVVWELR